MPLPAEPEPIEIGTGEILREGDGASRSSATAPASARRSEAADLLAEHGLDATVADARFAKPIDAALMAQLAAEHELLVTVEEGVLPGGFGSAVWETLQTPACSTPRDPARRPARPLRHARQAGAAARGGRLHPASVAERILGGGRRSGDRRDVAPPSPRSRRRRSTIAGDRRARPQREHDAATETAPLRGERAVRGGDALLCSYRSSRATTSRKGPAEEAGSRALCSVSRARSRALRE